MNTNPENGGPGAEAGGAKAEDVGPMGQNLFWVLLAVCVALGLDGAFRLSDLLGQREQLDQARLVQAQNATRLAQNQEAQAKLEPISFELLQIATTNDSAKKIVQEFNMKLNPGSPAPPPPTVPTSPSPAFSNPPPLLKSPPPASSERPPVLSNAPPAR